MPANVSVVVTAGGDTPDPVHKLVTLREAIAESNANTPDTLNSITFAAPLDGTTITLDPSKGELGISRNVSITAPTDGITVERAANTTISHRIFNVAGSLLQLTGMTVQNGSLSIVGGGGISSSGGDLLLSECVVRNNTAPSGGGIWLGGGTGSLVTYNSDISSNTASGSGGGIYVGAPSSYRLTARRSAKTRPPGPGAVCF